MVSFWPILGALALAFDNEALGLDLVSIGPLGLGLFRGFGLTKAYFGGGGGWFGAWIWAYSRGAGFGPTSGMWGWICEGY